jgi:cystathionine beta-lyase family protein involved in aluminum resistance
MTVNDRILSLVNEAETDCRPQFAKIDDIAFHNQRKVLSAFRKNRVADRHFKGTTG